MFMQLLPTSCQEKSNEVNAQEVDQGGDDDNNLKGVDNVKRVELWIFSCHHASNKQPRENKRVKKTTIGMVERERQNHQVFRFLTYDYHFHGFDGCGDLMISAVGHPLMAEMPRYNQVMGDRQYMSINADALSFFQMQALKRCVLVRWDFK